MQNRVKALQVTCHLLTTREVTELLSISRSTLYRGVKNGSYPRPVPMGTRSIRWRSVDIQAVTERGIK